MKFLLLCMAVFICYCGFSQHGHFIRVFDSNNHKIAKGNLGLVTDSPIFLTFSSNKSATEIHYSKIGHIKLRRSFGHTIAIVALANAAVYGILGAATAQNTSKASFLEYNATEGLVIWSVIGAVQGSIIGSVAGATKSTIVKKITPINGDHPNWQIAKLQLSKWIVK